MTAIEITREKLYPTSGRSARIAWKWTYSYAIDGAPAIEYGTHLASLRGMLKRKYAGARIVESWKN
jgi:hypothetical protein